MGTKYIKKLVEPEFTWIHFIGFMVMLVLIELKDLDVTLLFPGWVLIEVINHMLCKLAGRKP